MACFDCYKCPHWKDNGGNCKRFEYDCIYSFYKNFKDNLTERKQIEDLVKTIIEAAHKIDDIIDTTHNYGIPCFDILENAVILLKRTMSDDLRSEWEALQDGSDT